MAVTHDNTERRYSVADILNRSLDKDTLKLFVEPLGFDGTGIQRQNADNTNSKIVTVGSVTYIGTAAPGTAQSTAKWQCKKVDSSTEGTTLITWADGNCDYDNIVTSIETLTYS